MDFEEAKYIIIGMQCGWLKSTQKDYEKAQEYIIKHIDKLSIKGE